MKFSFKLEGLLKLRKSQEQKCMAEMGKINQRIYFYQEQMILDSQAIDRAFRDQESSSGAEFQGREIQFIPLYTEAKRTNIELLKREIKKEEEKRSQFQEQLNRLRAETKVVSKLKEKKHKEFKKDIGKRRDSHYEDLKMSWNAFKGDES